MSDVGTCRFCQFEIPAHARVCGHCGRDDPIYLSSIYYPSVPLTQEERDEVEIYDRPAWALMALLLTLGIVELTTWISKKINVSSIIHSTIRDFYLVFNNSLNLITEKLGHLIINLFHLTSYENANIVLGIGALLLMLGGIIAMPAKIYRYLIYPVVLIFLSIASFFLFVESFFFVKIWLFK